MNIIKFKDIIKPDDALFNTYLKGKYAYWIQMRYIVPFEFITQAQYVEFEGDITKLINWRERGQREPNPRYWDLYKKNSTLEAYVDIEKTEAANNIAPFKRNNQFTTDENITIDEIKKFRTWLAQNLLELDCNDLGQPKYQFYTEEFTSVLEYYANGMYDVTVKRLSKLNPGFVLSKTNVSNCGCGSGTDISGLYGQDGTMCDALAMYKKSVWSDMCEKFSDLDFWTEVPTVLLWEFKAYIDNIITLNLPLAKSQYISTFADCSCQFNADQMVNMDILRRLSNSLGYIANDEVQGNKNYITKALRDWSADLYEQMEWK